MRAKNGFTNCNFAVRKMDNKICCVGLARQVEVVSGNFVQLKWNIALYLDDGRVSVEHPRGGKLYLIVQTADALALF